MVVVVMEILRVVVKTKKVEFMKGGGEMDHRRRPADEGHVKGPAIYKNQRIQTLTYGPKSWIPLYY